MPSIPQFAEQLKTTCDELKKRLDAGMSSYIDVYDLKPQKQVVFLQRTYPPDVLGITKIAPWEGRWDTMKPVIKPSNDNPYPLYLVEHRNN
jgi:hypothetical protein